MCIRLRFKTKGIFFFSFLNRCGTSRRSLCPHSNFCVICHLGSTCQCISH